MIDPQPTDAFAWTQAPWGRMLTCRRLPAPHLFTSRDVVLREDPGEWRLVAASLDVPVDRLRLIRQVHGTSVALFRRGQPAPPAIPEADVIVSDDPSIAIGVRVADCAPLLLFDARTGSAAAAHAGWRGTAADVAGTAVRAMRRAFGTNPGDLTVAIGPCLGACCGEVGPDVVDAFRAGGIGEEAIASWFEPGAGDRCRLDLPRANTDLLAAAGVPADRIFVSGLCTRTHPDRLHSYRASGASAGRMLAAIRPPVPALPGGGVAVRRRAAPRTRPSRGSTGDRHRGSSRGGRVRR